MLRTFHSLNKKTGAAIMKLILHMLTYQPYFCYISLIKFTFL